MKIWFNFLSPVIIALILQQVRFYYVSALVYSFYVCFRSRMLPLQPAFHQLQPLKRSTLALTVNELHCVNCFVLIIIFCFFYQVTIANFVCRFVLIKCGAFAFCYFDISIPPIKCQNYHLDWKAEFLNILVFARYKIWIRIGPHAWAVICTRCAHAPSLILLACAGPSRARDQFVASTALAVGRLHVISPSNHLIISDCAMLSAQALEAHPLLQS